MKKILGVPVVESVRFSVLIRHIGSVILFSGLGYFLTCMTLGTFEGDTWKYLQSTETLYVTQFFLLLSGIILGNIIRGMFNYSGIFFFHYLKVDKYLYPLGFIIAYLVINEIGGL